MIFPTAINYHAVALYLFSTLDPLIRFLFLPWGAHYVSLCVPGSWAKTANLYGLLFSALCLGRIIGSNYDIFYQKHSSFNLVLLVPFVSTQIAVILILYCLMVIVNRYNVLVFIFLLIGLVSGRIASLICMKQVHRSASTGSSSSSSSSSSPFSREGSSSPNFEIDSESYDRMNAFVLIFAALFSGYLYDESPGARFPAMYPSLMLVLACAVVFVFFSVAKMNGRKSIVRNISKTSSVSASSVSQRGVMTKIEHVDLPPRNFIEYYKGDISKATAAYTKTLTWRAQGDIDNIFITPQRDFHNVLKFYPHAIHGRATDGSRVVYEVLGRSKPRELSSMGIGPGKLIHHFTLRNEFIFHRFHRSRVHLPFDPSSGSMVAKDELNQLYMNEECVKLMTVLDVKDIRVTEITADVITFIKQSSDLVDNHYIGRVTRLVVINAPTWFWSVWSMIERVLPDSVRKKIVILNDTKGLENFIPSNQRPVEYGGTDVDLGSSPEHLEFLGIAEKWHDIEQTNYSQSRLQH